MFMYTCSGLLGSFNSALVQILDVFILVQLIIGGLNYSFKANIVWFHYLENAWKDKENHRRQRAMFSIIIVP